MTFRDPEAARVLDAAAAADSALRIVSVSVFAAVDEPGAAAIVADHQDGALIPQSGSVMVYGDGGAGKTTLAIDLAFHLAAGDAWLALPVPQPVRVLLVEAEGPRPHYRKKLRRKLAGWTGSPLSERLLVFEEPWARFSFADERWRQLLADICRGYEVDVVIVGPVSAVGMEGAGTIPEVRAFSKLVDEVRDLSGRPLAFLLVHHENRTGKVSGAWEGVGETLLHVTAQGHGHLRLYMQKARWSSELHQTTLRLAWAEGDSFTVEDPEPSRPERTYDDIAEYVLRHGGCNWNEVNKAVSGQADYLRRRRDVMLADGVLLNLGKGQALALWHRDDPARPTLDLTVSEQGRSWDAVDSDTRDGDELRTASQRPLRSRDAVGSTSLGDPDPPPDDQPDDAAGEAADRSTP
jgi:hypothetical protein